MGEITWVMIFLACYRCVDNMYINGSQESKANTQNRIVLKYESKLLPLILEFCVVNFFP